MDPSFLILGLLLIGVVGYGIWQMKNAQPVKVIQREVVRVEPDPYRYHTFRSWNPYLWRNRRFRHY